MSDLIKGINPSGDTQAVAVDASGQVKISGTIVSSGADGSIVDGVSAAIKATVKNYTNSKPLTVVVVDTNGDVASIGGGTQYTEDAAAAANPVGTALMLVREDARAGSLVSADGDNVAARGNNKGELYVKHTDNVTTSTEQTLDYDSGGGTATMSLRGIALPASGGPVAGGTLSNPIQVGDAGGNLSIDDGGNSITIDGSLTTVSTVTTITNVVHVDDNAGSLTVDGTVAVTNTSLTTLAGTVKNEDVASASADPLIIVGAIQAATPADTAGTDLDYAPLQMSGGRLWVDASGKTLTVGSHAVTNAGTFAVQAAEADGANVTLGAKADAKSTATDTTSISAMSVLKQISASVQAPPSQAVTNAGTFVTQENGSALTSLQLIDDPVIADDAAFTPATSKVMMAGFQADESSTDSVDEGDAGAARMTLDRKVIVTSQPHTAGGLSTFMASGSDGSTALTSTAQVIKASAGQVYGYYIYNPNATAQFVHFYNTAAGSVTVGTTNPLFSLTIPATSAANLMGANGVTFTNAGFSIAATATAGGNGAPSTALDAVIWYI